MDYEKAYKEAFKRASNLHKDAIDLEDKHTLKVSEIIFPELRENENERIKKSIISLIQNGGYMSPKDKEKAIAWLENQGQNLVEWSDENKKIIDDIIEYLECWNDFDCGDEPFEEYCARFEKYIKFMESLKPQSHWKPSEEHITYLQAVVNDVNNIGSESCCIALRDLLEQLKSL